MKEYIEREAAIEILNIAYPLGMDERAYDTMHSMISKHTAADVRPVVLCRDCKHNKGAKVWRLLDDVTADCSAGHGYPPMDWFCADGEKREES